MDALKLGKYILTKMKKHQDVIGIILACLMLLLKFMPSMNGSSQALKTRPSAAPTSVTSNGSKVFDSWTGNLKLRNVIFDHSEVSVVFYYAPWSARSMDALRELEEVALLMYKQVSFVAVNCWWNQGDCRVHFQFYRFPQIYIRHQSMKFNILYDGPLTKNHIIYFLNKVLNPYVYLSTKEDAQNFTFENQFTVLVHINPSIDEDLMLYSVIAIKQLEIYDLPMRFGVIVNDEIAKRYRLKPNILQVRNNAKPSEIIHIKLRSSINKIIRSLEKLRNNLISPDVDLPGVKTNYFYQTLYKGPTLIVFISNEDLERREYYVKKIRQLVFQYNWCPEQQMSTKPLSKIYAHSTLPENKCCQSVLFEDSNSISLACSICVDRKAIAAESYYANCGSIEDYVSSVANGDIEWMTTAREQILSSTNMILCTKHSLAYNLHETQLSVCCQAKDNLLAQLKSEKNPQLQEICIDEILSKTQELSSISTDNGETVIRDSSSTDNSILFTDNITVISDNCTDNNIISGISCKTNRTLQFLTLDLTKHKALSLNLGVDPLNVYNIGGTEIGAVIFDPISDLRHVMTSSHFHLENFIINYTLGILPQSYHTTNSEVQSCVSTSTEPCVQDITSSGFEKVVLNNEKDVLLLYYVPWCLSCSSISHIYLSLARLLSPDSPVELARIDAYDNELPSHLTVQSYPTFILFPAERSSYSSVFPQESEITVANLLSFIFKNGSLNTTNKILQRLCANGNNFPKIQKAACMKIEAIRSKLL